MNDLRYSWLGADDVMQKLEEFALLLAAVFKDPPWSFVWHEYAAQPNDDRSPQMFLRKLCAHGTAFLEARHKGKLIGYSMMISELTEEALAADYVDLRTYGKAEPGNAYLAGSLVYKDYQRQGIGTVFMNERLQKLGPHKRCLLRTQEASGAFYLALKAGLRDYCRYQLTQAGAALQRVMMVREAELEPELS